MPTDRVTLSERWTIVNDLPLFYRVSNDAAPQKATPIVFVHGFGISGRYMIPTAELLASSYPAYIPDLPGYGRSHRPRRTLSIPELAVALGAFLDAVGIERVILLGNSMGCLIALEFARAFPDRIDRAILVSPAGGPNNQPLYRGLSQLARDALREPVRLVPVALPDYVGFGPINSMRLFHAMTVFPTVERALSLDLPMLIVVGARDPLVSIERLRILLSMKPSVTMLMHEGAAHAINFSHPEGLSRVVRSWLEGQSIESGDARRVDALYLPKARLAELELSELPEA
jgi:pimeloyl-ACP methyl ester carboxylesterase